MRQERRVNLFSRTRYSLAEEDRVVNALAFVLQCLPDHAVRNVLNRLSVPIAPDELPQFEDHVAVGAGSIVDMVVSVPHQLAVYFEAKVVANQFEDPEQVLRYWTILKERPEPRRFLLLVSPDERPPAILDTLGGTEGLLQAVWLSWQSIIDALAALEAVDDPVASFLVTEFMDYLRELGLQRDASPADSDSRPALQLRMLLGNVATERILLHIYHHGRGYINWIRRDHGLGVGETQRALTRLVEGQILVKRREGSIVFYHFNERNPLVPAILTLVRAAYENIPEAERQSTFSPKYKP